MELMTVIKKMEPVPTLQDPIPVNAGQVTLEMGNAVQVLRFPCPLGNAYAHLKINVC